MDLTVTETGCEGEDKIQLVQDRAQWSAFVITVIHVRVP